MSKYTLTIGQETFEVEIGAITGNMAEVHVNQTPYQVSIGADSAAAVTRPAAPAPTHFAAPAPVAAAPRSAAGAGAGAVTAPIPGKILQITVQVGDKVAAGQVVAIMEAMKMENNLLSPIDGSVAEIRTGKDVDVNTGDVVMIIA